MKNERIYYPKVSGIVGNVMPNTTNGAGLGLSRMTVYTVGDLSASAPGNGAKLRSINMIVDDANDDGTIETLVPGSVTGAETQKWQIVIVNSKTAQKRTINYIVVAPGGNVPTDLMAGAQVPMLTDANNNKYFNLENGDQVVVRLQITGGGAVVTKIFAAAVLVEEY